MDTVETPDLTALEERTYRASIDHGLIDVVLGGYFVVLGAALSLEWFRYSGLIGGLAGGFAFPLGLVLRRALVDPRLGHVRLNPSRRARVRLAPAVAVGALCAVILAGFWVAGRRAEFTVYPGFIPAMAFAAPIALAGYVLGIRRMYLYGALLLIERAVDASSGPPFEFLYWPSGLVIAAAGLFVLRRFLSRYPLPTGAGADA